MRIWAIIITSLLLSSCGGEDPSTTITIPETGGTPTNTPAPETPTPTPAVTPITETPLPIPTITPTPEVPSPTPEEPTPSPTVTSIPETPAPTPSITPFPETPAPETPSTPLLPITVTPSIAAKLLTQATFGATEKDINNLVAQNDLEKWIDEQFSLPISRTLPYVENNSNGSLRSTRHDVWWNNAINGDDQLRQRVAFALSQIFVISDLDYSLGNAQYGVSHYYDMLAENAFGNYRELLEEVTLHPTMGIYLGMVRNQKANPDLRVRPDENYAREILQLFSVGLYELNERGEALPLNNPAASYSQEVVEDFAKVFTGFNFSDSPGIWVSNDLTVYDKRLRMVADYDTPSENTFHDTTEKNLLKGELILASEGSTTSAEDDLKAALDNIANHPNVAPFFSKLLIQRLTTSNPSPEYVQRVASIFTDNGLGDRGNLGSVVKAILLDVEAINGRAVNPNFGKIKEPLLQLSQIWRAFSVTTGTGAANNEHRLYAKSSDRLSEVLGQAVLRSPSVFNFFLPDNPLPLSEPTNLLAPEMQIMTEANMAAMHNAFHQQVYIYNNLNVNGWDGASRINIDKAFQLAEQPTELIEYLNNLLLAGDMDEGQKIILQNHLKNITDNKNRALDAIFLTIASPQFMVQE